MGECEPYALRLKVRSLRVCMYVCVCVMRVLVLMLRLLFVHAYRFPSENELLNCKNDEVSVKGRRLPMRRLTMWRLSDY